MGIIISKNFSLAVVASPSSDLSIEDKIKLYEDTIIAIEALNKPLIDAKNKKITDNFKLLEKSILVANHFFVHNISSSIVVDCISF
ncbi:TPA: hypothetical protein ACISS5_000164 [Streptococcus pyogenes]